MFKLPTRSSPGKIRRGRRKVAAVLGLSAGVVVVTAGLAFGAVTATATGGTGMLLINLELVSFDPPCAVVTPTSGLTRGFAWQSTFAAANYESVVGGTTATYNGPITVNYLIDANDGDDFYEGPDGTHGTDSTCDPGTLGDPWPGEFQVGGTNAQGSTISCISTDVAYSRIDEAVTLEDLGGTCSITEMGTDGTDIVHDDPTTQTMTGTFNGDLCQNLWGDMLIPELCFTFDQEISAP